MVSSLLAFLAVLDGHLWLSWKTPLRVGDKITDEIDYETRNGPVSDVLCKAPHAARFRHMILPEVCCLEQVKLVYVLS